MNNITNGKMAYKMIKMLLRIQKNRLNCLNCLDYDQYESSKLTYKMIIMPFRILKNFLFILMQGESGVVSDERGCDSNENTTLFAQNTKRRQFYINSITLQKLLFENNIYIYNEKASYFFKYGENL